MMSIKIKVDLNGDGLELLIKKLKASKRNLNDLGKDVIEDLKQVGLKEISDSISNSNYEDSEPISTYEAENAIGIKGAQALYDEYGTGTVGANNPHPKKDSSLNPYNSGKTIRPNAGIPSSGVGITEASKQGIPLNGLYWTYKHNGKKIYTQGRPAGKHVYKASQRIRKEAKKIIEKRVGEVLSKL